GPGEEGSPARSANASAQAPQGAAMAIVRTGFLQPTTIEAHEVSETPARRVEGRVHESRVPGRRLLNLGRVQTQVLQQYREQQGAGVIIRAVTFREVGDGIARMLKHAGRVRHAEQMVEPEVRKLRILLGECANGRQANGDIL